MASTAIDRKEVHKLDKLQRLFDYLVTIREENFTGYIKINFTQGNLGRVEKFEEILKK